LQGRDDRQALWIMGRGFIEELRRQMPLPRMEPQESACLSRRLDLLWERLEAFR
jgi:hypothetical protein